MVVLVGQVGALQVRFTPSVKGQMFHVAKPRGGVSASPLSHACEAPARARRTSVRCILAIRILVEVEQRPLMLHIDANAAPTQEHGRVLAAVCFDIGGGPHWTERHHSASLKSEHVRWYTLRWSDIQSTGGC